MTPRGRGRPRKNDIEAVLGRRPPWLPIRPLPGWQTAMLASIDRIERELVSEYRHSPVVTSAHALALALLGEVGPNERTRIAAADALLRKVADQRRRSGGRKTQAHWAARAVKVLKKNSDLVAGHHSATRAGTIMVQQWSTRGDGDPCPNPRTLAQWIAAARKMADS